MADATLKARLSLDDGQFVRGLKNAESSASGFGRKASAIFGDARSRVREMVQETDRLSAATKKAEVAQAALAASFAKSGQMQAAQAKAAQGGFAPAAGAGGVGAARGSTGAGRMAAAGAFAGASFAPFGNEIKKGLGAAFGDSIIDPLADIMGGAIAGGLVGGAPGAGIGALAGFTKAMFSANAASKELSENQKEMAKAATQAEVIAARAGKETLKQRLDIEAAVEAERDHAKYMERIREYSGEAAQSFAKMLESISDAANFAAQLAREKIGETGIAPTMESEFAARSGARAGQLGTFGGQRTAIENERRDALAESMRMFQQSERTAAERVRELTPAQIEEGKQARLRAYKDERDAIEKSARAKLDALSAEEVKIHTEQSKDDQLHQQRMKNRDAQIARELEASRDDRNEADAKARDAKFYEGIRTKLNAPPPETLPSIPPNMRDPATGKKIPDAEIRKRMQDQGEAAFKGAFEKRDRGEMLRRGRASDDEWRKQFEPRMRRGKGKPEEGEAPIRAVDKQPVKIAPDSINALLAGLDKLILA